MSETKSRPITAASFFQFISEERLMATHCVKCDEIFLPPRAICPHCHDEVNKWTELSGEGKIVAFTSIYIAPTFMIKQGYGREAPYLTGIIELKEGPKISARVLGLDPILPQITWIGTPMVVEYLHHGEGEEKKTDLAFRVR